MSPQIDEKVYSLVARLDRLVNTAAVGGVPLVAFKSADEARASTTTLANDGEIKVPLLANRNYVWFSHLGFKGAASGGDFKWSWDVPVGAFLRYSVKYRNLSGVLFDDAWTTGGDIFAADSTGTGVNKDIDMMGAVQVGATAGNLQLTWSQDSSSGTSTTLLVRSMVAAWPVTG
jgi:hypothetical protein